MRRCCIGRAAGSACYGRQCFTRRVYQQLLKREREEEPVVWSEHVVGAGLRGAESTLAEGAVANQVTDSKGTRHDAPPGFRMLTNVGKGHGRGDGGGGGEGLSTSVRLDSIEGGDVRTSNQPGGGKGTVRTMNARPGTGMCHFFLEGCCNRGSACRYQHAMQTPAQAAGIDERVPHDLQGRNTGKGEGRGKGAGCERGEARPN